MEVLAVQTDPMGGTFRAAQEMAQPDGSTRLVQYVMPVDVLEWRAAEYGIDPKEVDLLMDLVLYEPLVPPVEGETTPPLFTASSVEEAREIHVGRVMAVKQKLRPVPNAWKSNPQRVNRFNQAGVDQSWIDAITTDALEHIRTGHLMNEEVVAEKAALISHARRNIRSRPASRFTESDRVQVFRQLREGVGQVQRRRMARMESKEN